MCFLVCQILQTSYTVWWNCHFDDLSTLPGVWSSRTYSSIMYIQDWNKTIEQLALSVYIHCCFVLNWDHSYISQQFTPQIVSKFNVNTGYSHFVNSHFVNSHFVNSHLVNFPLCQFPFCQFPFGQCWQSGNWQRGNWQSGKLTKWEDSPFEIILTTVIDHSCVSELLDKHIMKNIHGTLVPACSILSQVLTINTFQFVEV